jgi:hypothetical protein
VNGVRIQPNRLAVGIVVRRERVLHVLERSGVVDLGRPVRDITASELDQLPAPNSERDTHSQGSIKCGPATPRLSKNAYIGISQKPGSFGWPLQMSSAFRQSFASPLSSVYGQNASVPGSVTGIELVAEES